MNPLRALAVRMLSRLLASRFRYTRDHARFAGVNVGEFTYGCPTVLWPNGAQLSIGSFCSIASNVTIMLGGNHRTDWVSTYPFPSMREFSEFKEIPGHPASKGDVVIGSDVWIGQDALILSGSAIGHGAVVGARSVVSGRVAPYTIVVGNPARRVKQRFDDDTVRMLLEIEWWNWPLDKIRANVPMMLSGRVDEFIKKHGGGS